MRSVLSRLIPIHRPWLRTCAALSLIGLLICSCGGGGGGSAAAPAPTPTPTPVPTPVPVNGTAITTVKLDSTSNSDQTNVPFSFGQVFAPGDLPAGNSLFASLPDGSTLGLQLDVKATHADGSIRHAIVSGILPKITSNQSLTLTLNKSTQATLSGSALTLTDTLAALPTTTFTATLGGQAYSASPNTAFTTGKVNTWLSGPVAGEWLVSVPLTRADGSAHPHLTAQFTVRRYAGTSAIRIDSAIENGWAYQSAPGNFTYDAQLTSNGQTVFAQSGLTHYSHARWRKTFWSGTTPALHIRHNTAYLIATRALPNYDQSLSFPESTLAATYALWQKSSVSPMGTGLAQSYMPTTGGRPDIGLNPGWAVSYLLSMDRRLKEATLGTADLAGSWSVHYRDQKTGRPVSVLDFPYMTVLGQASDTFNPSTKQFEAFPACAGDCSNNPNYADSAHEPNLSYLPYLVTGDYYHLEELEFWAMWNVYKTNPGYRNYAQGLLHQAQVRDQAWSLRTVADAAYILPDGDTLKAAFNGIVRNNLAWYAANYVAPSGVNHNGFNALIGDGAIGYNNNTGIAPWMDDFFTATLGHLMDLGFSDATPVLQWKAQFPVARMTDPGFCWISGAIYALNIRPDQNSPLYTSYAQAYQASVPPAVAATACGSGAMASALQVQTGEMTGYSSQVDGFPSNMQPALAASVDSGASGARAAWTQFQARSVKPDYTNGPQFDIIPR